MDMNWKDPKVIGCIVVVAIVVIVGVMYFMKLGPFK